MPLTDVELASPGEYLGHWQGEYTLTMEDLENMVSNADARLPVMVDYNHASLDAERAPDPALAGVAAGWIDELRIEGETLKGRIEWTDRATELIEADEYRYLSPVIDLYAVHPNTGNPIGAVLDSVGLTNRPFFQDQESVRSNARGSSDIIRTAPVSVRAFRNTSNTNGPDAAPGEEGEGEADRDDSSNEPTPNSTMADNSLLKRLVDIVPGLATEDELAALHETEKVVENSKKFENAQDTIEELREQNDKLQEEIEELKSEREDRQEEKQEAREQKDEELLEQAVNDYKIDKSERDTWKKRLKNNREGARMALNSIPSGAAKPGKSVEEPEEDPAPSEATGAGNEMLQYVKEQSQ